jgi:SAM-dependent methyltransferase
LAVTRLGATATPGLYLLPELLAKYRSSHPSFDLQTWTLCSIPDVQRALTEMRRVLKPHGQLLFVEHGRSPDVNVRRWQDRLTPLWRRIGGGCHLNRPIRTLVEEAGFRIEEIETGYMKGPRPMTFMYEGRARGV